jgi:hypothetical protein
MVERTDHCTEGRLAAFSTRPLQRRLKFCGRQSRFEPLVSSHSLKFQNAYQYVLSINHSGSNGVS